MPATFPVSYSTLCPTALTAMLAEQYGLKYVHCTLLLRGVGDTYEVQTSGAQYILRAYRHSHRSLPQVQEEVDYLVALLAAGVSVSYPVADLSGGHIQQLNAPEGSRCIVLFSFAGGQVVNTLNDSQLHELGRQLAGMHLVAATMPCAGNRWTYDIETTLHEPTRLLETAFADDVEGYEWLKQATAKVVAKLEQLNSKNFAWGYCHYDVMPKNFHFLGDQITIFDFDFLGYGWLVNDIMTFWVQLCLDVTFGRITQDAADVAYRTFIDAYQETRPLSDDELAAVPYLALGFWLFYSGFHTTHDQFYQFIQPSHLKQRFGMVRKMLEKHWN